VILHTDDQILISDTKDDLQRPSKRLTHLAELCNTEISRSKARVGCVPLQAVPWFRRLVAGLPPRRPRFDPSSGHVGFVVDIVALGQVFSEYFGLPSQFSFQQMLHTHVTYGAGTIGQLVASVSPYPHEIKKYCFPIK
jgi:hypothetical protein